ncbi:MAG TPA: ATP-binding protein [Jiangellales bacterium]|nr:ATP-binding protein [Jiangellales bacterium]
MLAIGPQFDDANVRLVIDADPALPARVDPDRIMQVLTNLLGNALLATPAGGTVMITARRSGPTGEIVVTDTGVGLDPCRCRTGLRAFLPSAGPAPPLRRLRVGLTIARGIARGHGGDVTASSPGRGQGASFAVVLPLRSSHR